MRENKEFYIKNLLKNIENNNNEKIDISFNRIFYAFRKKYKFIFKVFLFILIGVNTHTFIVRIFNPIFKGNFTLLISDPLKRDENNQSTDNIDYIEETAFGTTKSDIPTLVAFFQSSYNLAPIADELNIPLKDLKEKIKISSLESTRENNKNIYPGLIKVDYLSKKPKRDIKILNFISKKFILSANELRIEKLKGGLSFLTNQEEIYKEKLDLIQNDISQFRETNSLIKPLFEGESIREEERQILKLIKSLDNDLQGLNDIKLQIINDNLITSGFEETISKRDFFEKGNDLKQGLSISSSASLLLNEFNKVDSELAKAKSIYSKESKIVRSLEERVDKIKPILKEKQIEAVESAIKFNRTKRDALESQREKLNLKFKKMPKLISEYSVLENQMNMAEQNLTSIIDAKEKLKLEIAQNSVAWIIIEPPKFDEAPFYPSILKRFISSFFIGIFVSFIIALYIEKSNQSFTRIKEIIKNYENFSILGIVPYIKGVNKNISLNETLKNINFENNNLEDQEKINNNIKLESLRNIYTSIKKISNEKKTYFFNITSSIPEEGKTFLSILISFTFSQMGKKVLLVDSDLRKPKIHEYLRIKNEQGLTEILSKDRLIWKNYIQQIDGYKNLNIITTNNLGLDPIGLLSSEKFDFFIEDVKASNEFDYVFMNTTPVIGLSDSLLVSSKSDRDFLIISLDKVPKNLTYEAVKILLESYEDEKLPGIIINQVNESTNLNEFEYYDNYYSYLFSPSKSQKNNFEIIQKLLNKLREFKSQKYFKDLTNILKNFFTK